jgi:inner membrane protein
VAIFGHIAVGMAASRVYGGRRAPSLSSIVSWSAISLLPDIDFIPVAFGIPYSGTFGHRGATHSFAFAAVVAVLIGLIENRRGRAAARVALTAALIVASHPLLDAMTTYGPGCAFFWPLDDTRYTLPWRVLPTKPPFAALWSLVAFRIVALEVLLYSPLVVFSLWPAYRDSRRASTSEM